MNKLKNNVLYNRELIYNERKAIQFYINMFTAYNSALHSNKVRYRGCYDLLQFLNSQKLCKKWGIGRQIQICQEKAIEEQYKLAMRVFSVWRLEAKKHMYRRKDL